MLIPQLLFAHMLADYVLQTNWLVSRKGQAWDGLALHGFMVFTMSLLVLPQYIGVLLVPITVMSLLHTGQDWLKIYSGPRIKVLSIFSYTLDQFGHYIMIGIMQLAFGPSLIPPPASGAVALAATGASVITLTRFYEVTWWSNWLDMLPYMNRWRLWGYAERLAMFALTLIGLFFIAPLCVLPRLFATWQHQQPVWRQPRGTLEMAIGVALAIAAGLIVRALLPGDWRISFPPG